MYSLALVPKKETASTFTLDGSSITSPAKICRYHPGASEGTTVDDTVELVLQSTDPQAIAAAMGKIQRVLDLAARWSSFGAGSPVYLQAQVLSSEGIFETQVLQGWLEGLGDRSSGSLTVKIHLTRQNYWQGAEVQVPVANAGGTPSLNQWTIYDHDDAGTGHDDWIKVIPGDLPAAMDQPSPARVELRNNTSGASGLRNIYMGLNASGAAADQASFQHVFEGESGAAGNGVSGASTADANCSGGNYMALTWEGTSAVSLLSWTLTTANLDDYREGLFRFLLRLRASTAYTDLWLKLKILTSASVLGETPYTLVTAGDELIELPAIRLPPFSTRNNYYQPLTFSLYARRYTAGAQALGVDYLAVMPQDGWRKLSGFVGLPYQSYLQDDSAQNLTITETVLADPEGAFGEYVTHLAAGRPLMLYPAKDQRLYVLWDRMDGSAAIANAAGIKLYVRPRRVNL